MKKLKLPAIKKNDTKPKHLDMDEYVEFVYQHLRYSFDRKRYQAEKKRMKVNVPFVLK